MSRPEIIEILADDFGWPREYLMSQSYRSLWYLLANEIGGIKYETI